MGDKLDTANYPKDHPYYTNKYKKDLHRFQRDVVEPNYISRLIAVNPKEYFLEKSNNETVKKHKGVKCNTRLTIKTYLNNIQSVNDIYQCSDKELLRTETFRQERLQMEVGIVTKVSTQKVALSMLHDKRYIFSDSILSLPFGHVWLKPIYEHNKLLTKQELQSNLNIRQLMKIEQWIVIENEYLQQFINMTTHNPQMKYSDFTIQ